MTQCYDINPMPYVLDIKCPKCGGHATFEFAEMVQINLKKDIKFFEESNLFDYCLFQDPSTGHRWHAAIFYPNLHGGSTSVINNLPDGYKPEDWEHSKYLPSNPRGIDLGAFRCLACNACETYVLNWPNDAFYQIEIKGSILWAFNRDSLIDLRDFILSKEREVGNHKWLFYLRQIPTVFKSKSNREKVVKKLNKLID